VEVASTSCQDYSGAAWLVFTSPKKCSLLRNTEGSRISIEAGTRTMDGLGTHITVCSAELIIVKERWKLGGARSSQSVVLLIENLTKEWKS
jgi:hypothetical protein